MADRVPLVDYLVLSDDPHLVAHECERCGARFFDRRNACASCGATNFHQVDIPRKGTLLTYTIVSTAGPGIQVPFVAAVVDCGGTTVRGNLVNVQPDPGQVRTGMEVRLTTVSVGTDGAGVEAVGYGFEPA
ncbi:Zn-ribbon domain-containing OB-fold protein [Pseudofrankia asymbiotica]|uniref:DUF35 domain-containing protein n=1 Tax=Pseudofrankia asymbiotica TaxID=1834516 RepID=A0A1V2IJI4_9ACTN|nr:OB-fold domain-containing protein [Pseudofrankia asymbiotica]ONH33353.1 hypothetical protein BL253_01865 [Pseudofrankia asymbiotica]